MSKHLRRDMERIEELLLQLGAMVEESINKATIALVDRRADLIDEVIRKDQVIDHKEVEIEEECLKLLALHQPVATDLRFIVAVLKVNNDLERMGDLAINIAERAAYLNEHEPLGVPLDFNLMVRLVREMVSDSLDSLIKQDVTRARAICQKDDAVDAINKQMYEVLQARMTHEPATVKRAVTTLSASRHLERIADLATNIAEDVVFMVEGEVIRHGTGEDG